jgi:plastocyanin
MKAPAIIAVVLVLVIGVAILLLRGDRTAPDATPGIDSGGTVTPSSSTTETEQPNANEQLIVVTFTNNGFSPARIEINRGGTVTFRNESAGQMWVASDPHPTHTGLPSLDSKRGILPGATYAFTFSRSGNWGYHNHLDPSQTGVVTVR